jgi:hypothetical protein
MKRGLLMGVKARLKLKLLSCMQYIELILLLMLGTPYKWSKLRTVLGRNWKLSVAGITVAEKSDKTDGELREINNILFHTAHKVNNLIKGVEIMWAVVFVFYVLTLICCIIGSAVQPESIFHVRSGPIVAAMLVILINFILVSILSGKLVNVMKFEVERLNDLVQGSSFYLSKKAKSEAEMMVSKIDWVGMRTKKVTAL